MVCVVCPFNLNPIISELRKNVVCGVCLLHNLFDLNPILSELSPYPATAGAVKVGILVRDFATMNPLVVVQSCLVAAFIHMKGHGKTQHDHPRCRSINGVSEANYAAAGVV